ncbi:5'-methylthioadenosine/S-adenosylhomocysteine nucleosidase [Metabacillus sp. GX 13764]|uniref:5'-methylthioadenosine/S-adenosylhomocysteine nucleosidase n=1 Tax=Metabacillus kandeliae TaxID=2900151 RepID=UPI001E4375BE|nr:5'-methylthioadenosine/S-adenosylhomocysteine nucleosidase [Metabacillus kandeliae]MCD7033012.1 5'-methylthioadenosine/S-adenosylhomocysteine nucleosidase [Metabacillus kandeliae]
MRIAIIGAMEEEVAILREKLGSASTETVAGSEFTSGVYKWAEIVLLKSGIGKVNAAISTTLLLDRFQPDYVINTGSAGGFYSELNVGDIVISKEVRHHDVDVTAFGYEYGQVPGLPPAYLPDPLLLELAEASAFKQEGVQITTGLIVTGDSFMNDPERVEYIRTKFKDIYAAEMEAAAIAQVCHQFGVPFVIIRALSDIAGKESDVSFEQFLDKAAVNSAGLVLSIAEQLNNK